MRSPLILPATADFKPHALDYLRSQGHIPFVVNDVYIPHFFHPARVQVWYGGSGSGKSDAKATELLIKGLTRKHFRCLFLRKYAAQVRDSQFLLFKDLIKRYRLDQFAKVKESEMDIVFPNGNALLSGGLDDVDKLKSVADVTDIWIEEPIDKKGSVSSADFTELDRRLRSPLASNHIHFTFNPITSSSWIYEYFFQSESYRPNRVKTTYLDNAFAPASQVEQFDVLRQMKPDEWDVYANGNWGKLKQGLVFPEYEIVEAMPAGLRHEGYGLDWGFEPDPTAVVHCGVKDGKLYIDELVYQTKLSSATRSDAMQRAGVPKSARIAADRNPEAIEEMKLKGWTGIRGATKGPGSVKAGLDKMASFKICITARSKNLKTELDNYAWQIDRHTERPTGEPIDLFNHGIDAARYYVSEIATAPAVKVHGW